MVAKEAALSRARSKCRGQLEGFCPPPQTKPVGTLLPDSSSKKSAQRLPFCGDPVASYWRDELRVHRDRRADPQRGPPFPEKQSDAESAFQMETFATKGVGRRWTIV